MNLTMCSTVLGVVLGGAVVSMGCSARGDVGPQQVTVSLATSTVSVSSATVATGATATLTLQAKDANNTNLTTGGLTVIFTATGGTSTGTIGATTDHDNGTYTAIFTAGSAGTARTIGATIGGSAVTSTLPTITVTATSAAHPNEPGGMTMYADRDFNSTSADGNGRLDASQVYNGATGWSGGTFSFSNGNYAIVSDASAPVSPPNVAQITYRVDLLSGFNPLGPNSIQQLTVPSNTVKTLYTHQRIKLSSNWLPPGNSNVAKLGFIKRQDNAPITYIVLQGSASPFKISFRSQNFTYPGAPPTGWQRNLGAASDDNFAVNVWNDLEILLTMNSAPGVFDGSVDVWLNGKHIISTSAPPYNGTTYARPDFWDTAGNPGFWQGPSLEPTWGGADNWPNPTETRAWWDKFYVSGKP